MEILNYALSFYNNHIALSILILLIALVIEGPIIILTLSVIGSQFGFGVFELFILSFVGDLVGDIIFFYIGVYGNKIKKLGNNKYTGRLEENVGNKPLLDVLIFIKYTPGLPIPGLIYLGFQQKNIKDFLIKDTLIVAVNSLILVVIGYFFGSYLINLKNPVYIIIGIMCGLGLFYFVIKYLSKLLISRIK